MSDTIPATPALEALRPQFLALLELYRASRTEDARAALALLLERAFLATACSVAEDLLQNGWTPQAAPVPAGQRRAWLKLVGGTDAA